jgi:hypothetical protein
LWLLDREELSAVPSLFKPGGQSACKTDTSVEDQKEMKTDRKASLGFE